MLGRGNGEHSIIAAYQTKARSFSPLSTIPTGADLTGAQPASRKGSDSPPRNREPIAEFSLPNFLPQLVLLGGLAARVFLSWKLFFNPDEALHALCADQTSLGAAYRAALTNAHPPLLILVLYYWRMLGHSELILRMPSILAGTMCCWFFYKWLELVARRSTAFIGLLLMAFSPSLIALSAEVRQYALLLFFISGCLYFSERAIRDNSSGWMIAFTLSLYGALLTHYSSFLFALAIGIYMLVRLRPYSQRLRVIVVWATGQIGGATLAGYFLFTHLLRLNESGLVRADNETYLRRYMFHAGEDHVAIFIPLQTLRAFTYLFSHGLFGTLALLAFLAALVLLVAKRFARSADRPSCRELALLLSLPFVIACVATLAGAYPYGATRHSIFLAPFAVAGTSLALGIGTTRMRIRILVIAAALAVCNFFPSPPPLIRTRNQARPLMNQAMAYLQASAPPGAVILGDYQSSLLLGYYGCHKGVVQIFPPLENYSRMECGHFNVIAPTAAEWKFNGDDFPNHLDSVAQRFNLAPGTKLWLFDAGWINDSTPALLPELRRSGCPSPRTFGENILICELEISDVKAKASTVAAAH